MRIVLFLSGRSPPLSSRLLKKVASIINHFKFKFMKQKLMLIIAMVNMVAISHAQWQLNGNSISSGDFLGSTNSQPLIFKVNNYRSGLIDYDQTKVNTVFGYQSLLSLTSGVANTGMGNQALYSNTSGSNNIAYGHITLYNNTTGSLNVAVGSASLFFNTTGGLNTSVGFGSLSNNTTADSNV